MKLPYEISTSCCNYTHRCVDTKISPTFGPALRVGEPNEHGSIECKFSANWLAEGRTGYGWIKRKHEMIGEPAFVLMSPVKWSKVGIALVQSKKHTINKTICTCENTKKKVSVAREPKTTTEDIKDAWIIVENGSRKLSIVAEQTERNDNRTGDGVQCYPLAGALTSSPTVHLLSFTC